MNIIVIPIYKAVPSQTEEVSFLQNVKVLSKHLFSIVTHSQLDISYYTDVLEKERVSYQVDFFDRSFFDSLKSYNRLLLSSEFYNCYKQFDYMLITQLDVYVFRDELDMWCNKAYDYIGAPWFSRFRSNHNVAKLEAVGNGGFSLRKIQTFLDVFKYAEKHNKTISLTNFWNVYDLVECNKLTIKNIWLRLRGVNNNLQYYLSSDIQEDVVWSQIVPEAYRQFKIATIAEAISFSFESDPSYLLGLNNNILPFGCHAWQKNQYEEFWKNYIKI
ncbi:hypothetical protein D0T53_01260 [Dysgonomonas sp. 216]|uniref:DUF5672 family protein n=1 Tax=Dysgonomonas sp. 216 TaxID=2302934 RepID=UPI0013D71F5C|nr:DUF5672 family protein [Dysgonomonas sp. 216]NDW17542.1 hypothetical protein [Dysgonomonas sp. 216]